MIVVNTKRKGIRHLEDVPPLEFLSFAKKVLREDGVWRDVSFSLKVDGAGIRFGKDEEGKFFFESSRSGIIQRRNAFSDHARENDLDIGRAKRYDDLYVLLEESTLWKDLPNDTKVVAEVLYVPLGVEEGNRIKFVTVSYDKNKLGSLATIVPFEVLKASTGESHEKKVSVLESLLQKSNSALKVVSPDLGTFSFHINNLLNSVLELEPGAESVLASRKAKDRQKKEEMRKALKEIQLSLVLTLLGHSDIIDKDRLGDEIEGMVLRFDNQTWKIVSSAFKEARKA